MGSGRFGIYLCINFSFWLVDCSSPFIHVFSPFFSVSARAYLLGYNCDDEKELEAALRFC